jgi:hypothetical protein
MDTAIRTVRKRASNREIAAEPAKVAFQPGASEGVCGLLFPRGFKIIRDRRRSGERNHESQKSDFRMDEHSPISRFGCREGLLLHIGDQRALYFIPHSAVVRSGERVAGTSRFRGRLVRGGCHRIMNEIVATGMIRAKLFNTS